MSLPPSQVTDFHERWPGISEDLLLPARSGGIDPYDWLLESLPPSPSVLDLACGSAPVADRVGSYLGVDQSPAELEEAGRRRPGVDVRVGDALDPAWFEESYDAVVVSMALMLLDLDRLVALALQSAPLLVAIVPRRGDAVRGTPYGDILAALGVLDEPFPTPLDDVPGAEVADRCFLRPADPDLVLASFYALEASAEQRAAARALLTVPLDYPLRRLVWRRP